MSPIVKYACEALAGVVVNCIMDGDDPWFKAKDVATALKYKDTDDAIRVHVADDDKRTQGSLILNPGVSPGLKGNWKNAKYINESGLYCLIFGSKMEEAKVFKHWVTREVLPAIRKTGSYNNYRYSRNQNELGTTEQERWKTVRELAIGNEDELQYKIITTFENNTLMHNHFQG